MAASDILLDDDQSSQGFEAPLRLMLVSKFLLAIPTQGFYIFAPFLAVDDANLTLSQYRLSLMALELAGFFPMVCPGLDRCPPNILGGICVATLILAILLPHVLPGFWWLAVLRFAAGCAWNTYSVACNAVLTAVDEHKRTESIAYVEMSWFVASFMMPVLGFGIKEYGVQSCFLLLASLLAIMVPANLKLMPLALPTQKSSGGTARVDERPLGRRMFGLCVWFFLALGANAAFLARYGAWLKESFGMNASQVGTFSNSIAIGNLAGNALTQLAGRWGVATKNLVQRSTAMWVVACIVLALVGEALSAPALFVLILVWFIFFEMAIIGGFSYASALSRDNPMKGMSWIYGSLALGRILGDWLAPMPETMSGLNAGILLVNVIGLVAVSLGAKPLADLDADELMNY